MIYMKKYLLFIILSMLICNVASAVKLSGKNVDDLVKKVVYDSSEQLSEDFEHKLRVTANQLYICNRKEYNIREKNLSDNIFYYKSRSGAITVLGITGIELLLENLTDDTMVIDWSESLLQLGNYSGIPFFSGMKYIDAANPEKTPKTIIPPHFTHKIALLHGNPIFREVHGEWQNGYAPIKVDRSLYALVSIKTVINDNTKYYTYKTPHIILPIYAYYSFIDSKEIN